MALHSTRRTAVFAKAPEPGRVKTRLCPPLSPQQAAELAAAMLADVLERHAARSEYVTELVLWPPEAVPGFRARHPELARVVPQRGQGLGERLANWFAERCDGAATALVVGSDCPLLGPATVTRAHELLEGLDAPAADVVFAPDGGGGYGLVGLRRAEPALFLDVPMSTPDMFARTLALARRRGLAVALLPPCEDVDAPTDLARLAARLASAAPADGADFPSRTRELLRTLPIPAP